MLNGVGGKTIAEAQENISYEEFLSWCAYIKKRGELNFGMRVEAGFALVTTAIANANGSKAKVSDFMPHKDEVPADIKDIFAGFKNMAAKNNAKKKRGK